MCEGYFTAFQSSLQPLLNPWVALSKVLPSAAEEEKVGEMHTELFQTMDNCVEDEEERGRVEDMSGATIAYHASGVIAWSGMITAMGFTE